MYKPNADENLKIEEALKQEMVTRGFTLAIAESCTGGSVASLITTVPGASEYFLGSFVTYSYELKQNVLGVSPETLAKYGAVSEETVIEMINGLFDRTSADYALSISGIAGPTGGSEDKPVGTIWIALGKRNEKPETLLLQLISGDRLTRINIAVHKALSLLLRKIKQR